MKFAHVIQAVYFQPWSITEAGWFSVHEVLRPHLAGEKIPEFKAEEGKDIFGNDLPQYEMLENGVAVVPVKGTLIHHASLMDKQCGAVSYDDIKRDINRAMDEGAKKIVLDMDTPGGMCMGCAETGRAIKRASDFGFRVEAVTDSMMCSGGYWLASNADAIYTTQTSEVGSIGVITAFMDQSERYKMAGVKPVLFTSGDLKGTGYPGTSLSEPQAENIRNQVTQYFEKFRETVLANRLIEDDSMRGQSFAGDEAERRGLVDRIIDDIEERFELDEN